MTSNSLGNAPFGDIQMAVPVETTLLASGSRVTVIDERTLPSTTGASDTLQDRGITHDSTDQSVKKRKRKPLSEDVREKTKLLRAVGACENCRRRKLRCDPCHHRTLEGNDSVPRGQVQVAHRATQIFPAVHRPVNNRSNLPGAPERPRTLSPGHIQSFANLIMATGRNQDHHLGFDQQGVVSDKVSQATANSANHSENPPSRSHDTSRSSYSIIGLSDFAKDLEKAAKAAFPNHARSGYTAVYVLMVRWEIETDEDVIDEMDELAEVFLHGYGYSVCTYKIPIERCHQRLSKKILEFIDIDDDKSDTLKILYYRGYSFLSKHGQAVWQSHPTKDAGDSGGVVKWTGIQMMLEEARSDVLLLLDAVTSGLVSTDAGKCVTELISASAYRSAEKVPNQRFTKSLIAELQSRKNSASFSVVDLYTSMFYRLHTRFAEDTVGEPRAALPIHILLTSPQEGSHSIRLSRMQNSSLGTFSNAEKQLVLVDGAAETSGGSDKNSMIAGPHVLISIALEENDCMHDTSSSIAQWLGNFPALIKYVKVDSVYKSY